MQRANLLNYDESLRLEQLTEYKEVPMVCGAAMRGFDAISNLNYFIAVQRSYALNIEMKYKF